MTSLIRFRSDVANVLLNGAKIGFPNVAWEAATVLEYDGGFRR